MGIMDGRTAAPNSDELHIYKAKIYDNCKEGDDRIQVRVLPYMALIPDSDLEHLPKYPPFFKGQVIRGFTEKDDGPDKASLVFILANTDFTFGYVMGLANDFPGPGKDDVLLDSYNFSRLKAFLTQRGIDTSTFNYNHIIVQAMSSSDEGGLIEMYNFRTGEKFIVNRSGTCIVMSQNKIYLRVGSPAEIGIPSFSKLEMTPNSISMKAKVINIDGEFVKLGNHGSFLAGFNGVMPVSVDGQTIMPIPNILV